MEKVWKDIEGYEGKYQVSDNGEVRSLNYGGYGGVKLLKQCTHRDGYKRVALCKNGKRKYYFVHRLVAIAFISNPHNYKEVNHKDECKSNNNMNNLEWCTREYNLNYGTIKERFSEHRKGKNSPSAKPILMYDKEGNFIKRFECISDVNEYFNNDKAYSNVSACLRGITKTAYNYIFKYEK